MDIERQNSELAESLTSPIFPGLTWAGSGPSKMHQLPFYPNQVPFYVLDL